MKNNIAISVCIPTFNGQSFIRETITSALNQSIPNIEILISDDASTDSTIEEIQKFNDSRIRLIQHPENKGPAGNWNIAVHEARGSFIKIMGQDDLLKPECLEQQLELFERYPDLSLVGCKRTIINQQGKKLMQRGFTGRSRRMTGNEAMRKAFMLGGNAFGEPVSGLFPARLARDLKFNGRIPYFIDLDFWAQLLKKGDYYFIADPLCDFRVSQQAWSRQLLRQQKQQWREMMLRIQQQYSYTFTPFQLCIGKLRGSINYGFLRRLFYALFIKP